MAVPIESIGSYSSSESESVKLEANSNISTNINTNIYANTNSNKSHVYTFEEKERLSRRIQKLKKNRYYQQVEKIIIKYNPDISITATPSGKYMYFHNLTNMTYLVLDKYINRVSINQPQSAKSPDNGYTSEITKFSDADISVSTGIKFSNKERNLIKRKIYDNTMKNKASGITSDNSEDEKNAGVSNNIVFVKKSPVQKSNN